jgi:hypothetical protein
MTAESALLAVRLTSAIIACFSFSPIGTNCTPVT